jgi:hypothetical protein
MAFKIQIVEIIVRGDLKSLETVLKENSFTRIMDISKEEGMFDELKILLNKIPSKGYIRQLNDEEKLKAKISEGV